MCHFARRGVAGDATVFMLLLALAFTHEGALVLAATILLLCCSAGGPRVCQDGGIVCRGLGDLVCGENGLRRTLHHRCSRRRPIRISSTSVFLPAGCFCCWPARSQATASPSPRCGDCCRNAPSFTRVRSSWCRFASIGCGSINRFMRKTGIFCDGGSARHNRIGLYRGRMCAGRRGPVRAALARAARPLIHSIASPGTARAIAGAAASGHGACGRDRQVRYRLDR